MSDIKYEIKERIAILSEKGNWTKELNKVSWNDRASWPLCVQQKGQSPPKNKE